MRTLVQGQGFIEMRNGVECWKFQGTKYKIADVWESIRPKKDKVSWSKLLWNPFVLPKHVIIAWMTIQNRLPTKDRLQA